MKTGQIDVWDVETFDASLLAYLQDAEEIIRDYIKIDRQQFLVRIASDRRGPYPVNPYSGAWISLRENLMPYMAERLIRAWHYTRLTNDEVQTLVREGPKLSDLDGIRSRLASQVAAGEFTSDVAERLWKDSPFQMQADIRSGRFWMTSHPVQVTSGLVDLLVGHWGGESVYFWQEDPALIDLLQRIGTGRVVELKVPLDATDNTFAAAGGVIATFAQSIGCQPERSAFDLCIRRPLGPEAVLAIHSAGDAKYQAIGREYPERFVADLED